VPPFAGGLEGFKVSVSILLITIDACANPQKQHWLRTSIFKMGCRALLSLIASDIYRDVIGEGNFRREGVPKTP
jgi:hypothetical protein